MPGPKTIVSGLVRGARSAWWTGLGLLAVTQEAGTKVFEALVEEGKSWEQARRERTRAKARRMRSFKEEKTVEAVEERVREEVGTLLRQMGLPHRDDIDELHAQLDDLNQQIERLSRSVEGSDA